MRPNAIWLVDARSVVQVMVAEVLVTAVPVTFEMTGAGLPPVEVVKVKLADVVNNAEEFVDSAP